MRKVFIAIAALATIVAALSLSQNRAEAMALPAPAAIQNAIHELSLTEQAYHRVCSRRCGYYGCHVRCWRAAHYYRPYRYRYRYY